jgi:hypothetical protein
VTRESSPEGRLAVPEGALLRARTVPDLSDPLSQVLSDRLTGYLRVESGGAILLGDATRGVLTLADGVPVLAYAVGDDAAGGDALAALAGPGPARVETYRVADGSLASLHDRARHEDCRVPPDAPARQLADDPELAERTRERAPAERRDRADDSLASFLDDEERVAAIKTEARAEARQRAEEWGLGDELVEREADGDLPPRDG